MTLKDAVCKAGYEGGVIARKEKPLILFHIDPPHRDMEVYGNRIRHFFKINEMDLSMNMRLPDMAAEDWEIVKQGRSCFGI